MIHVMADRIACFFVQKEIVEQEKSEIYSYGMELMISTVINGVLIVISAIVMNVFVQTIVLLIPFCLLRRLAGGYHAKTHIGCAAGFISVYWASISLIRFIPMQWVTVISACMLIISSLIILSIGAVAHENRPVDDDEYRDFKSKSRITTVILLCAGCIGLYYLQAWFIWFSFGISVAAGSLVIAKIQENIKKGCMEDEQR